MVIDTRKSDMISARISSETYAEYKKSGHSLASLIRIGLSASGNFIYLKDRVASLEDANIRIQTKLTNVSERLYKIEHNL